MAAKRSLTIKQERQKRTEERKAPTKSTIGADRIDKLIAEMNKNLGGAGHVFRGSAIEERTYARRSTGIPTLDSIMSGGLPRGGLVEIGGAFSVGKTTLAIHFMAAAQADEWQKPAGERKAFGWVGLEPFSKRWARENGFWIPFSEAEYTDPATGIVKKLDPLEGASDLEKLRMEQLGIEDPYIEVCPFVLVQDDRGDYALEAALTMLASNEFAVVVVDSLGVAKPSKWLLEKSVQDSADFPREVKMIGDYTTRACLMCNKRYDENNQPANDGAYFNDTTVINLNHIMMNIGSQAMAPWKQHSIKGGEANKHNHHFILYLWKGETLMVKRPMPGGEQTYVYGHEVKAIGIKSKIGAPFLQGSFYFYTQPFESFLPGDIDLVQDFVYFGLVYKLIKQNGAFYYLDDVRIAQGREQLYSYFREDSAAFEQLKANVTAAIKDNSHD